MTETEFTPETGEADVSAYENTDLSQLNVSSDELPPTEKKLENTLIRVVFFGRIAAWISIFIFISAGLYGWTRNQSQNSWLMSLEMNTSGTPLCTWMNHGYDTNLRNDTVFRDFLISKWKQSYIDLLDKGHCLAPDTIAGWLDIQKSFTSDELKKAYESVIPKKFLGTTITSSPELDVISKNAPEHRMQHDVILQLLTDTAISLSDSTSRIICNEVRFFELTADVHCDVTTRPPTQPRSKAIAFMKELSNKGTVLITYPNSLDMTIEEKTNLLKTSFTVKMTFIPGRYEASTIQKLTYDKR